MGLTVKESNQNGSQQVVAFMMDGGHYSADLESYTTIYADKTSAQPKA